MRERELIHSIEWDLGSEFTETAHLISTQFSKVPLRSSSGDTVKDESTPAPLIASGGGGDELKIFQQNDSGRYVSVARFANY